MGTSRTTAAIAATLALALGLAGPALAQLSGSNADTTGSSCSANNADGSCLFSRQTQVNTGTQFKSRYAWNVNADIGVFSTRDQSGSSTHHVNFNASAVGGYRIDIATQRTGDINRVNDLAGCDGSADTSGVSGSTNIALNSGSLSLADPGGLGNGGDTLEVPFNQTSNAVIFRVSNGVSQTHNLTFSWNGSARSNSCEAAVRQGESSGTTTSCDACGYPGSPSRTAATDGHFVTISFTSLCGNHSIDGSVGEACDLGSANGVFGSCCTNRCQFSTSSTSCRNAADECDLQENCPGNSDACPADAKKANGTACTSDGNPCTLDQCNGTSVACQHPAGNGGTQCRASGGICDVAENCTGSSTICPNNTFVAATFVCRSSAGVCDIQENCPGNAATCPTDAKRPNGFACTSDGNPCTLDQCNGTLDACQHPAGNGGATCRATTGICDPAETCTGSSTVCPSDVINSSTTVCRSSAGVCDVAENCTGTSGACPANAFVDSSTVCRGASGGCDLIENCTGSTADCPNDSVAGAFVECRPTAGGCDIAEVCDGVSHACPPDVLRPSTFTCRGSGGSCDVVEVCSGTSAACPSDTFVASTVQCRGAAGSCDVAENCTGTSASCPANAFVASSTTCRSSAGACDVAELCTGSSAACPANSFVSSTTQCRAGGGICDTAENCTGSSATCPANGFASSATQCRAASGACDVAESCTGTSAACPADTVAGTTLTCRASASACDAAEHCDGLSHGCPADAVASSTTTCRSAAGACDVAETCTGLTSICPPDLFAPVTVTCRAAADVCDAPEVCTGLGANCPADLALSDGTPCNDASACTTNDSCQAGTCTGDPTLDTCLDDFLCYKSRVTSGTPRFTPIASVHLVDAFEDHHFKVSRPKTICTPADKHDGNGTIDASTHLVSYAIRSIDGVHIRHTSIQVTNQIHVTPISLDSIRPDLLLVPSAKDLLSSPPEPPNNSHNVDHYKCYKVRVTPGTPKFVRTSVMVSDQFIIPQKSLDLRKPRHLCLPVEKNGEAIKNSAANLLCYQTRPTRGQPKFTRRTGLYINNQFGPLRLDAIREREFCIPSSM